MRSLVRGVVAALIMIPSAGQAQSAAPSTPANPKVWAMVSAGRGDLRVNCGI